MLETLTFTQLGLAAVILIAAYFIRGIAGFGSGLIAIPLLALMLPLPIVVPMIGLLDYMAAVSHGIKHRERILWRDLLPLLPFSIIGIVVALYIFKSVDAALLNKYLGAFIILYALYSLADIAPRRIGSRLWAIPAGGLGGLIGTLFGSGGPLYVIYLKLRGLDKATFRATIATIFALDGAGRITGFMLTGFYSVNVMMLVAAGLPIMVISMYVGGHIHANISQRTFQRTISLILLGSGTALLLR